MLIPLAIIGTALVMYLIGAGLNSILFKNKQEEE